MRELEELVEDEFHQVK